MAKANEIRNLGNGYSLRYKEKENGLGGLHPVLLTLYKGKEPVKGLTDKYGLFFFDDYPGVEPGGWQKKRTGAAETGGMSYVFSATEMKDGRFILGFMVQPDGRYWEDEDGFGGESDEEIWLYALLDDKGNYLSGFTDNKNKLKAFMGCSE